MDLSPLKIKLGITSDESPIQQTNPTPLTTLLWLYENARYADVYCNYMEGFRLLVKWLSPIEIPPFKGSYKIPRLHGSYELNAIAEILNIHPAHLYQEYTKWTLDCSNFHTVAD